MGAPLQRGDPLWVNPCGDGPSSDGSVGSDSSDSSPRSPLELLQSINISARNALTHAQLFSREFVRKTFGVDYEALHREWIEQGFEWLPSKDEIPKKLGDRLQKHHLPHPSKHQLDSFLVNAYRYLQTIAVGLEQVSMDMSSRKGDFSKHFWDAELKLRQVLCEVHAAIGEREPSREVVDVGRDAMPSKFRYVTDNGAFRDIRDWFIFRDYMNCLEYIIEICEFFILSIQPDPLLH